MKRGFTVVEVMVTLIVIGILLGLGTVGLRTTLANGRDAERAADIEIIARGFEQYYDKGNPYYIAGVTKGTYPGSNHVISIDGSGWCPSAYFVNAGQDAKFSQCPAGGYWEVALPGVSPAALTPPDKQSRELRNPWLVAQGDIPAWIQAEVDAGKYVYLPLSNGSHCYEDGCPSYELYYKKETTGELVVVRSKRQ